MTPGGARNVRETLENIADMPPPMELTARQQELERLWQYYRAETYSGYSIDWDGKPHIDKIERPVVASSRMLPPGFFDAGGDTLPLNLRKPTCPYYLARVVVKRFSGLLFSTKRRPNAKVLDNPEATEWLSRFLKTTQFWSRFLHARDLGGAVGSVGVGFKFVAGKPVIEVHDARHCKPSFRDRDSGELASLEKKYCYVDTVRDSSGNETQEWFWYRRVIDREMDRIWDRVSAKDYAPCEEPDWLKLPPKVVEHNFGVCPAVWIQNTPILDDIDGDPDCHGAYELIDAIDALLAQSNRGLLKNADPTTLLITNAEMREVKKGSDNAIKLPEGGSGQYMEMSGSGLKEARDFAKELEQRALTTVRCVLDDNMNGPARTDNETNHNYSNMFEQADMLREQYGAAAQCLLGMVLTAVAQMQKGRVVRMADGERIMQRQIVRLPGYSGPELEMLESGFAVELEWPDYWQPGVDQVVQSVQAATQAKDGGLIDRKHATAYVARYFGVDNPAELAEELEATAKMEQEAAMAQFTSPTEETTGPGDDEEQLPETDVEDEGVEAAE